MEISRNIINDETQQQIDQLPAEYKVVAEKYLNFNNTPQDALAQAHAQEQIDQLPAEYKAEAVKHLNNGYSPKDALNTARPNSQNYIGEIRSAVIDIPGESYWK